MFTVWSHIGRKWLIAYLVTQVEHIPVRKYRTSDDVKKPGCVGFPGYRLDSVGFNEPGADLSQYNRVYLVKPLVAFKKNWKKNINTGARMARITTSDMERIKKAVSNLFMEVFTEELEAGGYTLAQERVEDVLIVRPASIDLYVNAPDVQTSSMSYSFTTSAGSMTHYLELYDSETDDLLAKALDPTRDRDDHTMQWQTSGSNKAAAKKMMRPCAQSLREGLDESRSTTRKD